MASRPARASADVPSWAAVHETLSVHTADAVEWIDITHRLTALVWRHHLRCGVVQVQTRHTTTGIVVNENEPLLLEDFRRTLERAAPRLARYAHDDPRRRRVNRVPDERVNGHAHCQALFLPSAVALNVDAGRLCLGLWQRVFFVELDGAQEREISVVTLGMRA
jgi:secondary thiamine-phosphate synthase enzyme